MTIRMKTSPSPLLEVGVHFDFLALLLCPSVSPPPKKKKKNKEEEAMRVCVFGLFGGMWPPIVWPRHISCAWQLDHFVVPFV